MPSKPLSYVGANHSCKILDPPLRPATEVSKLCTNEINSSSRDIFVSEFRFRYLNNSRLSPVSDRIIVYEYLVVNGRHEHH